MHASSDAARLAVDSERDRRALLSVASLGTAASCLAGVVVALTQSPLDQGVWLAGAGVLVGLAAWALGRAGHIGMGGGAFAGGVWTLGQVMTLHEGNAYPATASLSLLCIMLAGLLVSTRAAVAVIALSALAGTAFGVAEHVGAIAPAPPTASLKAMSVVLSVVLGGSVFLSALARLRRALLAARDATHDAVRARDELQRLKVDLEALVETRTRSLAAARDEAEAAVRAKSRFLARVGHDLRTPLHAVVGLTAVLRGRDLPATERAWVETIADGAAALQALVDDLFDLAALETGRVRLVHEPYAPKETLARCAALLRPIAAETGCEVAVVVDKGVPAWVMGDAARVTRVLLNLGGNAVRFAAKGSVVLRARVDIEDALGFEVEDDGEGMDATTHARLFLDDAEASPRSGTARTGTGLGLSIARQLVHAMSGTIGADAAAGRGARFFFVVPAPRAPDEAPRAPLGDRAARPGPVLVVEDLAANRLILDVMLKALRVEDVDFAEDGAQALAQARAKSYALVLLDMVLPDLDGLELIPLLRALPGVANARIVAVTASASADGERETRAAGADGYVRKPLGLEELADVLHAAAVGAAHLRDER